jgi:hypothetical protein
MTNSNYYWGNMRRPYRERFAGSYSMPVSRDLNAPIWIEWKALNPAAAQWVERKLDAQNFDFGRKMFDAVLQYGDLTPNQMGAIDRMIERDLQRAARPTPQAVTVDCRKIVEAFERGAAAGLRYLRLRFVGLMISKAPMSGRNAGSLYVKDGDIYLGKITGNQFFPSRDCTPEQQAKVVLVASDPAAAGRVYGNETGECCVCGRELTNAESIQKGIGPICEGRMGWTPGGLVRQAGVDF